MRRLLGLLAATTLLSTGAVAVGTGSVGAAATTTPVVGLVQTIDLPAPVNQKGSALIYAVHGLNLDGQDAQSDGGTAVTVCNGDTALDPDFQFGEIVGPLTLPWGTPLTLKVFLGADADCTGTDPLISQDVTVPAVRGAALVATAGPDGTLVLKPVVLDVNADLSCLSVTVEDTSTPAAAVPFSNAKLGAVHAANAGTVVVTVGDAGTPAPLAFGGSLFEALVPDTWSVEVTLVGTPIVEATLALERCTLTVVYVVGNQPIAEAPTTTTTAPAPAAEAVTAKPAFTG